MIRSFARDLGALEVGVVITGTSPEELSAGLANMEYSLNIGEAAELAIFSGEMPGKDELDNWYSSMKASGFHTSMPTTAWVNDTPVTSLVIRKGSPAWAALIPLIPTILITGLVAFGMVKIEQISRAILPLVLSIGGLAIIGLALMKQPAGEAMREYAKRR